MAKTRLDLGPWEYIWGGMGLVAVAFVLLAIQWAWIAWLAAVLASLWLMIGTVAQGVRVGMRAHRDDRLIEKYAEDGA
jgi:hypothetical protein